MFRNFLVLAALLCLTACNATAPRAGFGHVLPPASTFSANDGLSAAFNAHLIPGAQLVLAAESAYAAGQYATALAYMDQSLAHSRAAIHVFDGTATRARFIVLSPQAEQRAWAFGAATHDLLNRQLRLLRQARREARWQNRYRMWRDYWNPPNNRQLERHRNLGIYPPLFPSG